MTKKGFTLIELLIVVAIIGVLAAVVVLNLSDVKARAKNARRVSDLSLIADAFQMYYQDNKTYKIPNTGYNDSGQGWFSFTGPSLAYSETSIAQGLVNAGFLSDIVVDPSGFKSQNASQTEAQNHDYMFYYLPFTGAATDGTVKASVFARLENATNAHGSDISTSANPDVANNPYLMNYAHTINP